MRKALNENPRVQLAVLGVVGVVFAFILFTSVLGGEDTPNPNATGTSGAAASRDPATPEPAAPASGEPESASPPPAATPSGGEDLAPSDGLPKGVLVALARGKAVALIVIDPKGISDKEVKSYTERLGARDDVKVFVVKARNVADYAQITAGVQVNRTPALVVVQPRDPEGSGLLASVSYGFRSPKSVKTALEDALYDGETISPAPE